MEFDTFYHNRKLKFSVIVILILLMEYNLIKEFKAIGKSLINTKNLFREIDKRN